MTLPTTVTLPLHTGRIESGEPRELSDYIRDLVFELQNMYANLAFAVNGNIRADYDITQGNWTPVLKGSTVEGTFSYGHQIGYSLRQGLMTDIWFDVKWSSAGTADGNLILKLPYQVAKVSVEVPTYDRKPFVGIVQSSNVTFTTGTDIVINAIPNSYNGEFWNVGSGVPTANQVIVGAGQLIGHIRYIGKQNER